MLYGDSSSPVGPRIQVVGSQVLENPGIWDRNLDGQFRVQGSGFRVQGSGFRVQGLGFRVQGSGFTVLGSGFRAQSLYRGWAHARRLLRNCLEHRLHAQQRIGFGPKGHKLCVLKAKTLGRVYGHVRLNSFPKALNPKARNPKLLNYPKP